MSLHIHTVCTSDVNTHLWTCMDIHVRTHAHLYKLERGLVTHMYERTYMSGASIVGLRNSLFSIYHILYHFNSSQYTHIRMFLTDNTRIICSTAKLY